LNVQDPLLVEFLNKNIDTIKIKHCIFILKKINLTVAFEHEHVFEKLIDSLIIKLDSCIPDRNESKRSSSTSEVDPLYLTDYIIEISELFSKILWDGKLSYHLPSCNQFLDRLVSYIMTSHKNFESVPTVSKLLNILSKIRHKKFENFQLLFSKIKNVDGLENSKSIIFILRAFAYCKINYWSIDTLKINISELKRKVSSAPESSRAHLNFHRYLTSFLENEYKENCQIIREFLCYGFRIDTYVGIRTRSNHIKFAIEIDGPHHYFEGKLSVADKHRQIYLEGFNFIVLRFPLNNPFNIESLARSAAERIKQYIQDYSRAYVNSEYRVASGIRLFSPKKLLEHKEEEKSRPTLRRVYSASSLGRT
jgi:very-short-patch-repair endonuclease